MTSGDYRIETDSLGDIKVPVDCYWGAQTQRSLEYFAIGGERFRWQRPIIQAFGLLKKAAANSNHSLGWLADDLAAAIDSAAQEVVGGKLDKHFPLGVFQTGSGTHSNMNANEVIANRANELLGSPLGSKSPVHPNDHVNLGQSSNDVFPTVMHIAVLEIFDQALLPALEQLKASIDAKVSRYSKLVKTGRTHLQDAAPITLGQEMSAWGRQLQFAIQVLQQKREHLFEIAIGGTAVGTGLNSHPQFGQQVANYLATATGAPFTSAANKFFALSAHDPLVEFSASLRTLATALFKIANDVRWLASGPRCGIGELHLPKNEPGSSIMPGKVNPTQCEALTMVCAQVVGNDSAVAMAASQGNFQLNAFKPVIVHNVMESLVVLADSVSSFKQWCMDGLEPNHEKIAENLQRNLMLVTALNQHIGYDKAAEIAKLAERKNLTLKQAASELNYLSEQQFDEWVDALQMTRAG